MGDDKLSYEDLLRIINVIESSSHFTELHLKAGSVEVDLRRGSRLCAAQSAPFGSSQVVCSAIVDRDRFQEDPRS